MPKYSMLQEHGWVLFDEGQYKKAILLSNVIPAPPPTNYLLLIAPQVELNPLIYAGMMKHLTGNGGKNMEEERINQNEHVYFKVFE